jgi:hypothetical protein
LAPHIRQALEELAREEALYVWRQPHRESLYSLSRRPRNLAAWQRRNNPALAYFDVYRAIQSFGKPMSRVLIRFKVNDWSSASLAVPQALAALMRDGKIARLGTKRNYRYVDIALYAA